MITEQDLQAAIAECQGQRNPNASTCIKLAAFYTIRNELFGNSEQLPIPSYSYAEALPTDQPPDRIRYESDTDFGRQIHDRDPSEIWPLVDELISEALAALNPRLYDGFMRRLR